MKGNYWHGEIYLDTKKSIYQYFGFEKVPVLKSLKKLFRKSTRKAIKQSNKETPGNFRGDGFQMGGTVIINEQGQLIYKYSQQEFEEYPTIEEIIRVLNKNNPKDINSIPRPLPIIFKDSEPVLRHITSNESDLEDSIHTPELNEFNTIQSNIHALDEDPNAKINLDSMNMRLNQDCCDGHSMEY
ncbi:hypothetical protein K502DRAFT_323340 [Neoconidiobolus thromboides FSU 785]|nr:hypothetical protein K502DRAFT_323340 [Neoconidiobolus thromboides FSU 785]